MLSRRTELGGSQFWTSLWSAYTIVSSLVWAERLAGDRSVSTSSIDPSSAAAQVMTPSSYGVPDFAFSGGDERRTSYPPTDFASNAHPAVYNLISAEQSRQSRSRQCPRRGGEPMAKGTGMRKEKKKPKKKKK